MQTAEVGEVQHQPDSWPVQRRVVFKAEALAEGPNTRFVVTTRTERPLVVYARYVDRGEPENWIKDLKNALQADRAAAAGRAASSGCSPAGRVASAVHALVRLRAVAVHVGQCLG